MITTLFRGTYIQGRGHAAGAINYFALAAAAILTIKNPAFSPFLLPAALTFIPTNRRWIMK